MHECWKETLKIEGLPYDLLKVSEDPDKQPERIILMIPGLPGYGQLLETFARCLFEKLRGTHDIWVLSYCRFSEEDCDEDISAHKPLEFEVEHKLRFLESGIPKNTRVTLIGHSVGAYMILSILQMLKGIKKRKIYDLHYPSRTELVPYRNLELYHQIDKCYLLFPVIERIQDSPNGQKFLSTLYYLHYFFVFNVHIISKLPMYLRKRLVELLVAQQNGKVDATLLDAGVKMLTPRFVHNLLELATDNFECIKQLEIEGLKQCTDKLVVYYGESDGWCPPSYRDDLLKKVPGVNNHVDEWGIPHGFMVHHSGVMASLVAKHIKSQSF